MEKKLSSGLKTVFLIHAIVGTVVGLAYLLIPLQVNDLINWPTTDDAPLRLIGAAILGFAVSSWLAYRETDWEHVKIVVQMEIFWTILATIVFLWGVLFANLPAFGWVDAVVMAAFAIAFAYFYSRQ